MESPFGMKSFWYSQEIVAKHIPIPNPVVSGEVPQDAEPLTAVAFHGFSKVNFDPDHGHENLTTAVSRNQSWVCVC